MSGLCCGVRKLHSGEYRLDDSHLQEESKKNICHRLFVFFLVGERNKTKGIQGFLWKAKNLFTCSSRLPKEED